MLGLVFLPLILLLIFTLVALIILLFVLWIFMVIDCARREFPNKDDRIVWILVLVFLSYIGAIIYYFAVKRKFDKAAQKPLGKKKR